MERKRGKEEGRKRKEERTEESEEGGSVKIKEKKEETVSLRPSNRRDTTPFGWSFFSFSGRIVSKMEGSRSHGADGADAGHDCQEHVIRWPSFHMILQIGHPLCRRGT